MGLSPSPHLGESKQVAAGFFPEHSSGGVGELTLGQRSGGKERRSSKNFVEGMTWGSIMVAGCERPTAIHERSGR
jgi:hypothetical protein